MILLGSAEDHYLNDMNGVTNDGQIRLFYVDLDIFISKYGTVL